MRKVQVREQIETSLEGNAGVDIDFGEGKEESDGTGEFILLTGGNKEEYAKKWNVSVEFLDSLIMFAADLTDKFRNINDDLKDLGAKVL